MEGAAEPEQQRPAHLDVGRVARARPPAGLVCAASLASAGGQGQHGRRLHSPRRGGLDVARGPDGRRDDAVTHVPDLIVGGCRALDNHWGRRTCGDPNEWWLGRAESARKQTASFAPVLWLQGWMGGVQTLDALQSSGAQSKGPSGVAEIRCAELDAVVHAPRVWWLLRAQEGGGRRWRRVKAGTEQTVERAPTT